MFEKIQRFLKPPAGYEYAKASVYYVFANIAGQGIVLISSAVFTRMLDKTSFGLVSTYSTWVLVINTFICLNLFITVRNAYIDFSEDYDRYASSVLLLSMIAGFAVTILLVVVNCLARMNFSMPEVLLACIQSVALNVVNYELAIQSMQNRYKARMALMIAPNWTHTLLSIAFMLAFTGNLYMAKIAGNAFGMAAFGVICAIAVFRRNKPRMVSVYWKYALKISLPSVFNTLSDLILMQSDRLMLTALAGAEETAEYSVVYNVSSIILAIYQAVNGAWIPVFYKLIDRNEDMTARRYEKYYLLIFSVFTCGMMTISPEIIKIISPGTYWNGIRYVGAIVIASYVIFLYAFMTAYLLFKKQTAAIARNTVITAGINILLNYLLIPDCKSAGAVMATVISYVILFLLHYMSVDRAGKKFLAIRDIWLSLGMVTAYGAGFLFLKDMWELRYLVYVVFMIAVIWKSRDELRVFFSDVIGGKENRV